MDPRERVIVALDVPDADAAQRAVERLAGEVGAFKAGLELVNAAGPAVFGRLRDAGAGRIFYDAKLHDIPNTVAGAARAVARHGLWMVNVHASGGSRMVRAAADALREAALPGAEPTLLLGVTLLTSLSADEVAHELGVAAPVAEHVVHLARLAKAAGAQGVVASPHEVEAVRAACGPGFLIVTPGVRPAGADVGDQRRAMTPGEAVRRGADHLVVGRPIMAADNPRAAARAIVDEVAAAG